MLRYIVSVFCRPIAAVEKNRLHVATAHHAEILVFRQLVALTAHRHGSAGDDAVSVFSGDFPRGQLRREMDVEGACAAHVLGIARPTVGLHRHLKEHQMLRLGDQLGVVLVFRAPAGHGIAPHGGGEAVGLSDFREIDRID